MIQSKRSARYILKIFLCIVMSLSIPACSLFQRNQEKTTSSSKVDNFEVHIRQAQDLKQLDKIETILTVTPEKAAHHPDYQIMEEISVPFAPEYRIGPGDVVEIVYHIRYDKPEDNYLLEVQDKLSVNFPYHPQFSSTVMIRTDGRITVPLIGDVRAAGLSPGDLAQALNQKYGGYLAKPSITVALEEFNVKIRELKRAITTAPRGQSKIAPVAPDGRISFPVIGTLQAHGFTVRQLEKTVNEKYAEHVRNLNATLILLEIREPKFYIFGEIAKPGAYDMSTRLNLLDALALAGGFFKTANLKQVLVIRNEGLERPIVFKVDVAGVLKTGNVHPNLRLKPADIIYVPKGSLDEFNDLMEKIFTKGLYAIIPFTTTYSWNPMWGPRVGAEYSF